MNNIKLFSEDIKKSFILHIPHSSVNIPSLKGYVDLQLLFNEIGLVTDFNTDEIFNVPKIKKVKCNFNRLFCDVERMNDDKELLYSVGRGFFYTKTDDGKILRNENSKKNIYKNFYLKHHAKFEKKIDKILEDSGVVYILDCHSFNDIPLKTDLNKTPDRADICLGIDNFHTPPFLVNYIKNIFEKHNLSVNINIPYSGTIVPNKYYMKDKRINSIMIEVNKKIYLNSNEKIKELNSIIKEIFKF